MAKRIGLFGGTFDPVHLAHLAIAEWTRDDLALEQIIFIPNRIPPHKSPVPVTAPEHRLKMLELAIAGNPYFAISTLELNREGPSYTVETLRALRQLPEFAKADLFWIVGTDNLADFHNWHKADEIQNLCVVVAYPRQGARLAKTGSGFVERAIILKAPVLEVASTEIRRRLTLGHSIRYLVPDAVFDYIQSSGIYVKG
jgi:nicotinate-nucleotide adenylyltransferase